MGGAGEIYILEIKWQAIPHPSPGGFIDTH